MILRTFESSHRDLLLKYLFEGGVPSWKFTICSLIFENGFLENRYLFGGKKKCSWKIVICSVAKKVLLENWYLFGGFKGAFVKSVSVRWTRKHSSWKNGICSANRHRHLPGKLVSVRWTHKASWKSPEKGAPGRKEQIFSKIVSVAASELFANPIFCYNRSSLFTIFLGFWCIAPPHVYLRWPKVEDVLHGTCFLCFVFVYYICFIYH